MSRLNRNRQPAPSRRKKRSQRKRVDGINKEDEEIYECIVVRLPGEIGVHGETREGVSTAKTTGGVAQAVELAEHVTCPNDKLPVRASGAINTRSRAQAGVLAQEPEESAFTPIRGARVRSSVCGNLMRNAPHQEMNGISSPSQPATAPKREGIAADAPVADLPTRLGARGISNHDPAPTAETPKSIPRRSMRKIPVSHFPPVETKRSLARPARRVKEQVNRDSGVIVFPSGIDIDIPTEFEESNVRADLTDRPAIPVRRGGG